MILIAALTMVAAHNLLDTIPPAFFGSFAPLWVYLHAPGVLFTDGRHVVFAAYPLIPWAGVTAAGWGLGRVFLWEPGRRRALLIRIGVGLTIGFIVLRAAGVYGDPRPWEIGDAGLVAALSFLNTNKYLPSLAGRTGLLRPLRRGALDVRVADAGPVPGNPAARMAICAFGGVRVLDPGGGSPVSALPLVRSHQGAPRSLVAQLSVTLQEPFGVRAARLVSEEPGVRI